MCKSIAQQPSSSPTNPGSHVTNTSSLTADFSSAQQSTIPQAQACSEWPLPAWAGLQEEEQLQPQRWSIRGPQKIQYRARNNPDVPAHLCFSAWSSLITQGYLETICRLWGRKNRVSIEELAVLLSVCFSQAVARQAVLSQTRRLPSTQTPAPSTQPRLELDERHSTPGRWIGSGSGAQTPCVCGKVSWGDS